MNKTKQALVLTVPTLIFIAIMILIGIYLAWLIIFNTLLGIAISAILIFVLLFLAYRFM
ncbi:gp113 (endogenous virus) [Lactococcus phage KSY1]|uniref:Gp113 n=1 Tax=Lactococcus phage KSY1 TaxID=2913972 RepID=A6MAH8_9CAUD|nr:gp113 [Lactococcus phage KSY1]ABG21656.1 gp113 [Lactococcus phage KSY1]